MKKIGIVVAMSVEFDLVEAQMRNKEVKEISNIAFVEGDIADKHIILAKSGMGKVCSAVGVVEMIRNFAPDAIINTGVAGGIDMGVKIMDIVVGDHTVYHDTWCGDGFALGQVQGYPEQFTANEHLLDASKRIDSDIRVLHGLICSGDSFITSREELAKIKTNFPAGLAVDMESNSMAQVCYMYNTPFISFRIISDTPGVDDHIEQYNNFWAEAPKHSFKVLEQLIENI
ncbi:MAG: 5'-methylthioadenosine/adenosylhomocysteine nucleosidase [Marinifilaceae bacterium]